MMADDGFQAVFTHLKDMAEAMVTANLALQKLGESVLAASHEHRSLGEQLERVEHKVDAQAAEIRALRERLG